MKLFFTVFLSLFAGLRSFSAPPTVPSSNLSIPNTEGNSITFSWTAGNGTNRLIIARKDLAVTAFPVNGVDYAANNSFGQGNEISPGQFVVYKGSGNVFGLINLTPGSTYHIAIFEFNGNGFTSEYLTAASLSGNHNTLSAPSGQVSNLTISNVTGNSMRLNYSAGNGSSRIILAKANAPVDANPFDLVAYSYNSQFGNGTQIGSGNFVVANGGTQATITGLQPNTSYHFAAFELNGSTGPVYQIVSPAVAAQQTAPRPSLASSAFSSSNLEGNNFFISWLAGNGAKRIVIAKAGSAVTALPVDGINYTASSSFGSGQQIAPDEYVVYNGSGSGFNLSNLQHSTTYHFAIFEYDGDGAGASYLTSSYLPGSQTTLSTPTLQTSNLTVTTSTNNSITLSWTNGNGSQRMIIARQGMAVNAWPVNYTTYVGSTFGMGSQIGPGNWVVYIGSSNTATITGLAFNSSYHFAILELNGNSAPVYLVTNPSLNSGSTSNAPTIPANSMFYNIIEGNSMSFAWNSGNGAGRIVVAKANSAVTGLPVNGTSYTANNNFGSGATVAPGEFVIFNGSGNSLSLNNLAPGITYHFAVFEYAGSGASTAYLTSAFLASNRTTLAAPTIQTISLNFGNVVGNSIQINLSPGNGSNRMIIARQGSPVTVSPVNFISYPGSNTFGIGSQIGTGNYVVHNGGANNVTITGLQPNTTYHFAAFEYNGSVGPVYNTISPAINNTATLSAPTIASSAFNFMNIEGNSMQMSWTSGNGTSRIVIAKQGSPVTAVPVNGTSYSASNIFGSGTPIGPGEFVVAVTSSNFVAISNLLPATNYYFAVYEFDGSGANTGYLTSAYLSGSRSTVNAPTIQASGMSFTNITNSTMTINWTSGNGSNRLVVVRAGNPVTAVPVDLTAYFASVNIGSAGQITPGNFVVSGSATSSTTVHGLQPYTTYYFAIYEFNGSGAPMYLTSSPPVGSATTAGPPLIQTTNAVANAINSTAATISWTNGDGHKRIVLMKANSPVDAIPVNDALYTANTFFGSGSQVGSGNYAVFTGNGNNVTVTNLNLNNIYHVAIFEYNEFGPTTKVYLTINPARATVTMSAPQTPATNAFAVPVNMTTATINWVNGNGHKRIVLMKANSSVDAGPVNGIIYADNTVFGSGSQLGTGNYTVYNGTGSSVTVNNLVAGNIYHIAVFEYNDFGDINKLYLTLNPARASVSFGAPQVQAVNAVVNSVNSSTAIIGWTNGSGHKRIVLMKANAPVDANPVDGNTYTPSASFGSGTQVGSGNYTVFNGIGNNVTITNLNQANVYHIAVFEYNDFGTINQYYLTISPARAIVASSTLPVTLVEFNAKESDKRIILQWSTTQEYNSAEFEIQRSPDGSFFERIGSVPAAGTSSLRKDYSFIDKTVFSGHYYYRLKQVDLDGRSSYSGIIHIQIQNSDLFKLLTNPVRDHLKLLIHREGLQPYTLRIFDMTGKTILQQADDRSSTVIDVTRLTPGTYIAELKNPSGSASLKFIKLK